MQESLATEHSSKLLAHTLEELLDGGAVSDEGSGHLESSGRDVAHGGLDVVGDPFNEVAAVLVLNIQHLFVDFLHGHTTSEEGSNREVSTVSGIASGHHVLGIEHLLGQFWHSQGSVLLTSSAGQGSETRHKKVKTREGDHVYGQFSQVSVQLTGESKAGGHTRHGCRDQMVQVTVGWSGQLKGSEADIVEGFVVNTVGLVSVLNQLMD
jgi:hypothetical protein